MLVFLKYAYPSDERYSFSKTRTALITISLVCTMVFCLHSLYKPNEADVKGAKIEQQSKFHDEQVVRINEAFDKEKENITAYYNALIDEQIQLREKEKLNTFGSSKEFKGPRYEANQAEIERLEDKYSSDLKDVQNRQQSVLEELSVSFYAKIKSAEKEAQSTLESGSPILKSTVSIFNFNRDFPEEHYIFLAGFLSLLFTIILESVIMASFSVLAFQHADDFNLQRQSVAVGAAHKINQQTIKEALESSQKNLSEIMDAMRKNATNRARKFGKSILDNIKKRNHE